MRTALLTAVLAGLVSADASAQTNVQVWGNVTLNWLRTSHLTYELDVEPKVLVKKPADDPGWRNLDVTASVEYAWRKWLDAVGELATGATHQTDDVNSVELSPRIGVRLHLFSRDLPTLSPRKREASPTRRVVVRNLLRVESRNLFYTDEGHGTDSSIRFRNRLEFLFPLNTEKITDDRARYLLADWEWFIPLGEPDERFANKQRIRAGLGFRHDVRWRFEALYIWARSRNTISEDFTTSDHIINVRVKRVF